MASNLSLNRTENIQKKVAILVENEFEDVELKIPKTALRQAGAKVIILGARMNDRYRGHHGTITAAPDATTTEVCADSFDALMILGGSARANPNVLRLVREAIALEKWIVAIGYGPQVLIDAEQLSGKRVTGFRAIRKDIENAGATYIDAPTLVDGKLITARRPGDLPIVMTTLFRLLNLSIPDRSLPKSNYIGHDWWELGAAWGGSSRADIVRALETAVIGERYTTEIFRQYAFHTNRPSLLSILSEIIESKRDHANLLEKRLHEAFNETVSWQVMGGETLAALQGSLQKSDDIDIMRKTLGDLQTGIIDAYRLCNQLSDPTTVEILDKVEDDLSKYEQCLAALYRRVSGHKVKPPLPTTAAVMH